MAQSAGKSRSKPTRNSDSVLGEGEFICTTILIYFLVFTFTHSLHSSNQGTFNYDVHLL